MPANGNATPITAFSDQSRNACETSVDRPVTAPTITPVTIIPSQI